jgi:hypothetical protein
LDTSFIREPRKGYAVIAYCNCFRGVQLRRKCNI